MTFLTRISWNQIRWQALRTSIITISPRWCLVGLCRSCRGFGIKLWLLHNQLKVPCSTFKMMNVSSEKPIPPALWLTLPPLPHPPAAHLLANLSQWTLDGFQPLLPLILHPLPYCSEPWTFICHLLLSSFFTLTSAGVWSGGVRGDFSTCLCFSGLLRPPLHVMVSISPPSCFLISLLLSKPSAPRGRGSHASPLICSSREPSRLVLK